MSQDGIYFWFSANELKRHDSRRSKLHLVSKARKARRRENKKVAVAAALLKMGNPEESRGLARFVMRTI